MIWDEAKDKILNIVPPEPDFVTVKQVAKFIGVGYNHTYGLINELVKDGKILKIAASRHDLMKGRMGDYRTRFLVSRPNEGGRRKTEPKITTKDRIYGMIPCEPDFVTNRKIKRALAGAGAGTSMRYINAVLADLSEEGRIKRRKPTVKELSIGRFYDHAFYVYFRPAERGREVYETCPATTQSA